jgi:hypothetical protein
LAQLVAGREKDLDYVATLRRHGMVQEETFRERLALTELDPSVRALVSARLT